MPIAFNPFDTRENRKKTETAEKEKEHIDESIVPARKT